MPAGPFEERFPPGAVVYIPVDGGVEDFREVWSGFHFSSRWATEESIA